MEVFQILIWLKIDLIVLKNHFFNIIPKRLLVSKIDSKSVFLSTIDRTSQYFER